MLKAMRALIKELEIMANLGRHINVVSLLGAITIDIAKGMCKLISFFDIIEYD